jgi:hypothetical protein
MPSTFYVPTLLRTSSPTSGGGLWPLSGYVMLRVYVIVLLLLRFLFWHFLGGDMLFNFFFSDVLVESAKHLDL